MAKKLIQAMVVFVVLLGQMSLFVGPAKAAQLIQCDASGKCVTRVDYYGALYTENIEHGFSQLGQGTNSWTIPAGGAPQSFGAQIGNLGGSDYHTLAKADGSLMPALGVCDVADLVHYVAELNGLEDAGSVDGHAPIPVLPANDHYANSIYQNNNGTYDQDLLLTNPGSEDATIRWTIVDHVLTIWVEGGDRPAGQTVGATPAPQVVIPTPEVVTYDERGWPSNWQFPIPGQPITVDFGDASYEASHSGIDIGTGSNPTAKILAAGDGIVTMVEDGGVELQNLTVCIFHGWGSDGQPITTVYGHNRWPEVEVGQVVNKGQVLATSYIFQKEGFANGVAQPHLHFMYEVSEECSYTPSIFRDPLDLPIVVTRWDGSSVTTGLAPQSSTSPDSSPVFDPTVLLKPEVVIPSLSVLVILGLILIFVFIWFSSSENQVKAGMWIVEKISAREERRQNKARVLAERRNAPTPAWKLVMKEGYRIGTAWFFFLLVLILVGLPAAATLQARLGWEKFLKDGWFLIPAKVFVLFVVALVFDWIRSVVRKHKQARDPKAQPGTTIVVYKERPRNKGGCLLIILGLILLVTAGLYWWQVRPLFINIESDTASVQAWTTDLDKIVEIANQWGWGITTPGEKLGEWALGAYKLRQNLDIAAIVAAILGLGMVLSSFSKRIFSLTLVMSIMTVVVYVYGSKYIQATDPTVETNPPSGETLITTPVLPDLPDLSGIIEQQPPATSGELHLSCDFNAIEAGLGPANITCDENGYPTFPIRYWNGNSYQFYIEPSVLNASISAAKGNDTLALLMLAVANSESSGYNSTVCSGVGACGTWQFMPGTWTSYAPAGFEDPSYRYDTNIQAIGAAALIGDGANGYGGMRLYTKLDRQSFVDCFYGRTCATWNQHEPQADYVFRLWTALKVSAGLQ